MSRRRFSHQPDPEVTALLRARYGAPAGDEYWAALEARIMARVRTVADESLGWWGVISGWVPIGLAAAAAALLMAGVALTQMRAAEARVAYEGMVRNAAPLPVQTVTLPTGISAEEATFRYVISY